MEIPMVAVPVRCPKCGTCGLSDFPVAVVAIALVKWNNMCLYASCHAGSWDASSKELDAIRHHVGRDWIRENGQPLIKPHLTNMSYLDRSERDSGRKISAGRTIRVGRNEFGHVHSRPRHARDLN